MDETTLGMHVHLTYGWKLLHDDPAARATALLTPAGDLATIRRAGDWWILAIQYAGLKGPVFLRRAIRTSDDAEQVARGLDLELGRA